MRISFLNESTYFFYIFHIFVFFRKDVKQHKLNSFSWNCAEDFKQKDACPV